MVGLGLLIRALLPETFFSVIGARALVPQAVTSAKTQDTSANHFIARAISAVLALGHAFKQWHKSNRLQFLLFHTFFAARDQ